MRKSQVDWLIISYYYWLFQWLFQEPKLEVPTIDKAYFSGLNFMENTPKQILPQNILPKKVFPTKYCNFFQDIFEYHQKILPKKSTLDVPPCTGSINNPH